MIASSEAMVLLDATCEACREITRQFEEDCLKDMFGPARARLKMGRKDRAKPTRSATLVYRDGHTERRDVAVDFLPAAMIIPGFRIAGLFAGPDWEPPDVEVTQIVFGDSNRARDPEVNRITVEMPLKVASFARMISKIALGVAHYTLGHDAFAPIGREFIRSGAGSPNYLVGGFAERDGAPADSTVGHSISLWHHDSYLVVTVQVFAEANAPVNYAVVGRLLRMPPGLPSLHLGVPTQRRDRTPNHPQRVGRTVIHWDQSFESPPASGEPDTE